MSECAHPFIVFYDNFCKFWIEIKVVNLVPQMQITIYGKCWAAFLFAGPFSDSFNKL